MERVKSIKTLFDPSALFVHDASGMLLTNPDLVPWDKVFDRIERTYEIESVRDNAIRVAIGVELEASNPAGNTAVIDGGYSMYGPRPYVLWKGEKKQGFMHAPTPKEQRLLRKRSIRCYEYYGELKEATENYGATIQDKVQEAAYLTNRHQIMTGCGFDNNKFGDVSKAALNTVIESLEAWSSFDVLKSSKYVLRACEDVKNSLISQGMRPGSLRVYPADIMRKLASKDGLMPFPLYTHGFDPYTKEMDDLLLRATNGKFSAREHIGREYSLSFLDDNGERVEWSGPYPVIAALGELIESYTFEIWELIPLITTLERIQKTGFKEGEPPKGYPDYGVVQKDGKARSVSPTECIPGVIESMVCVAFNEECRRLAINHFPSIQNPETRHEMYRDISVWIEQQVGYKLLDIDLEAYDKHVNGSLLATLIDKVIKPFFHVDDWKWVDCMSIIANYKVMWIYADYADLHPQLVKKLKDMKVPFRKIGKFYAIALWSGLMSGMKGTHITFGSMYNITYVQRGPMLVYQERHKNNYTEIPFRGFGGGDDVKMVAPAECVQPGDPQELLGELLEIMEDYFGQKVNPSKLLWEFIEVEPGVYDKILIYLQEMIVPKLHVYGIGSQGRSAAGYFIKERTSHMSVGDQARAVIARAQNGWNDPMCKVYLRIMLKHSPLLLYVFSKYGVKAHQVLVEASKMTWEKWCEVVGVDDYYWGATVDQFKQDKLQIVPIIAEVAADMGAEVKELTATDSVRLFLRDMEDARSTEVNDFQRSDVDLDDFE